MENSAVSKVVQGLLLCCVFGLNACSTTSGGSGDAPAIVDPVAEEVSESEFSQQPAPKQNNRDPFEGYNRVIYKFNDKLDDYVLRPTAKAYDFILPNFIKKAITNFFANLNEPIVIVNGFLQAKFKQGAADTGRFLVNTTIGIAGFIDVASHMKLKPHDEDFGQTFAVWGIGAGPYIVWPFLGPKDMRDSAGWVGDRLVDPVTYVDPSSTAWALTILEFIDLRALYLGDKATLEQAAAGDPYVFIREAYRQRRLNQIYDGNPPLEDEDLLFED